MAQDYEYLLTDKDRIRIDLLIDQLREVISEFFSARKITPAWELDEVPMLGEMLFHELSSKTLQEFDPDPELWEF